MNNTSITNITVVDKVQIFYLGFINVKIKTEYAKNVGKLSDHGR